MSDIIKPTVGRKVWFMPGAETQFFDANGGLVIPKIISDQPLDATIVYVWGDRMVNLLVVDHNGQPFALTSVTLVQEGDATPMGRHCVWMPYQKGQAQKAAAIDAMKPSHAILSVTPTATPVDAISPAYNPQFQHESTDETRSFGVAPAVKPGESTVGFSLDDDAPLSGGVCDMSAGCESCQ